MINLKEFFKNLTRQKFTVFTAEPDSLINQARMNHLASLNLNIKGKSVLEVGAGIGLLTYYFEKNQCNIISTDSRKENIDQMKKLFSNRKTAILDLEKDINLKKFKAFDIVFCYGTLYHLSNPANVIRNLSRICSDMIFIETCVTLGKNSSVQNVRERGSSLNQSSSYIGSRPTRKYVMNLLAKYFGYAYITKTQPKHVDFILDWKNPPEQPFYRAVFVGAKKPIHNKLLLKSLPQRQTH